MCFTPLRGRLPKTRVTLYSGMSLPIPGSISSWLPGLPLMNIKLSIWTFYWEWKGLWVCVSKTQNINLLPELNDRKYRILRKTISLYYVNKYERIIIRFCYPEILLVVSGVLMLAKKSCKLLTQRLMLSSRALWFILNNSRAFQYSQKNSDVLAIHIRGFRSYWLMNYLT